MKPISADIIGKQETLEAQVLLLLRMLRFAEGPSDETNILKSSVFNVFSETKELVNGVSSTFINASLKMPVTYVIKEGIPQIEAAEVFGGKEDLGPGQTPPSE